MRILPKTPAKQIERLSAIVPAWAQDPRALGLEPDFVEHIQHLLAESQAAHRAALIARERAKAATREFELTAAKLRRQAAAAISTIKARALLAPEPARVMVLAQLPAKDPARRDRPPPTPTSANIIVGGLGHATLTWKTGAGGARGNRLGRQGRGGGGVQYVVARQPYGSAHAEILGATSRPRFVDLSPPPGRTMYHIRAVRGRSKPRSAECAAVLYLPR